VVAAGYFDADGNSDPAPLFSRNLAAVPRSGSTGIYDLVSDAIGPDQHYVVRGSVVGDLDSPPCTLDVLFNKAGGIAVRISALDGQPVARPFMVVVSRFPDAAPVPF